MQDSLTNKRPEHAIPIWLVTTDELENWLSEQDTASQHWLQQSNFKAKPGSYCLVPDRDHNLYTVIAGIRSDDMWSLGGLPASLPAGSYYLAGQHDSIWLEKLALGWILGNYQFSHYKETATLNTQLVIPEDCNLAAIQRLALASALVRDLINTPPQDMMPPQLAASARELAERYDAEFNEITGDDLLEQNYPTIHAVGRASCHVPRLIDMRWGDPDHKKITLVGKGVCFDSGGLDLKNASGMRLMKKDMGGAAHVLGLAQATMDAALPVRLRVLIPAVENAVSGNAFHPGDVIRSRAGITIEIDNTDAEGRLILCDALAEAVTEKPDLIIDMATLTGAARVAVGTEIAAYFCNQPELAQQINECGQSWQDPVWQLPLHRPYREMLDSKIANIANSASSGYAGAITAALFLQEFIPEDQAWLHFDLMAWNVRSRPGRPEGGEAMGLRALYNHIKNLAT